MIINGDKLINMPVMGLQTGGELAKTSRAIINPSNLEIVAYQLSGSMLDANPSILRIADVRELSDIGMIVDSSEEFITSGDVINIDDIYELNFDILNMNVIDEKNKKIGKVVNYTLDTGSFMVQQLSVKRPLLKSLNVTELLIHRNQITEINNDNIIIHSEIETPEETEKQHAGAYVNPFRKTAASPTTNNSQPSS